MKEIEIRHFPTLSVRAEGDERIMRGYAAPFNSESVDFGWFKEQIAPGAFARSLKERPDVRALADHDTAKVLARTTNGSLTLREDESGLWTEIAPNGASYSNDVLECVKRGDIDGMSIGFRVVNDKWEVRDGKEFRTLLDVELIEVSVVAFPAYPETSISARSAQAVWEAREKTIRGSTPNARLEHIKRKIALFERIG